MRVALALVLGLIATAASAQSRVFHVKNFGVDSPDCGGEFTPCRSISQGIRIASTGDTVLVGPDSMVISIATAHRRNRRGRAESVVVSFPLESR